mgnify:CR=1 FL=1
MPPFLRSLFGQVVLALVIGVVVLVVAFLGVIVFDAIATIVTSFVKGSHDAINFFWDVLQNVWNWITETAWPALQTFGQNVVSRRNSVSTVTNGC